MNLQAETLLGGPIPPSLLAPQEIILTPEQRALINQIEQEEKRLRARENFKDFIEYMMPDPENYDDRTKTAYISKPVHMLMRKFWTDVESGRSMRSALSVPPQTGKTTHVTLMGSAWAIGRNPNLKIMIGTYNENRAKLNGGAIRTLMESERYKEIFPEVTLAKGGKSKSYLETTHGGYVLMAGRGTGVTGNPCDIFCIDDPIKDAAEANSTAALEESWEWFSTTALQRAHNLTRYVIVHTRWAMNDLIGQICDPEHPDYDEERAAPWLYLNVKAFDNEPHIANLLEIEPEECIWPEKFSKDLLTGIQKLMGPEDFSALYMGKPVPDEGGFFHKDMINPYVPEERPPLSEMRIYAASDHAVTTKQYSDYTVLVIAGVDKYGQVWLLDLVRRKMQSDETVEEMIRLMKQYKPITWWAASDHISKAIGPFLRQRMREDKVYGTYVEESPEIGDKKQKSQSIRGMMALGLVRFPAKAAWYAELIKELLQFRGEGDAYDDQVDALGHLGRGLDKMIRGRSAAAANDENGSKFGTIGWIRAGEAAQRAEDARQKAIAGW